MTKVAVSMLNYKSAQSTIECIESLLVAGQAANGKCDLEIFLSDNASGEEDQRQLEVFLGELATVHFHINEENLGFSAGHNQNLATIFANSEPDYVWLLNNDCLVSETALNALLKCAKQRPEVGIWGSTLLEPDGRTIQCAGGCFYNTWIGSYRQYGQGKPLSRLAQIKSVEYDYIAGASLFFPVAVLHSGLEPLETSVFGKVKKRKQWLNEAFFLYFEELDLAQRLKPGMNLAWCRQSLIVHTSGYSVGTSENRRSAMAEYNSTLSALKYSRLYYPKRFWFIAPARFFAKCSLLVARGDFSLIKMVARAYRDYFDD